MSNLFSGVVSPAMNVNQSDDDIRLREAAVEEACVGPRRPCGQNALALKESLPVPAGGRSRYLVGALRHGVGSHGVEPIEICLNFIQGHSQRNGGANCLLLLRKVPACSKSSFAISCCIPPSPRSARRANGLFGANRRDRRVCHRRESGLVARINASTSPPAECLSHRPSRHRPSRHRPSRHRRTRRCC